MQFGTQVSELFGTEASAYTFNATRDTYSWICISSKIIFGENAVRETSFCIAAGLPSS